jgi:aryl-alcohol dehydrogenase-like predicted oxidoreductase
MASVTPRRLGRTDLFVDPVGLGAGPLGDPRRLDDAAATRLIHAAIDLGVQLIDTAPSYGESERRLGRALATRRRGVVLSTKVGYGVPGVDDWTFDAVRLGIDRALDRLATDWIDLVHLHSCPVAVLLQGDVIEALEAAVVAGKVRVAAYSGDGAALAFALGSGRFGSVQCSINIADQRALGEPMAAAQAAGVGVIAKRPLASGAFAHAARPAAADVATYWDRLQVMALPDDGLDPAARSLRFVLAQPGVGAALVGTTSTAHLAAARGWACAGPLPAPTAKRITQAFAREDRGWDGVI